MKNTCKYNFLYYICIIKQEKHMKNPISTTDFSLEKQGYGRYKVTYTSPVTRKQWSCITNDSELIDNTFHCDTPKVRDLNTLKMICKL